MMKRSIAAIALFVLGFLLIDNLAFLGLEYCHRRAVYESPQGIVNWYIRQGKRHDFVILGASKAKYGIKAKKLGPSSFSLAWGGMDDAYASCVLDLLIQKQLKPKALILTLNPQNYYQQEPKQAYVATNPLLLKYYYFDSEVVKEYINETSTLEPLKFLSRSYRFNPNALNLLNSFRKTLPSGRDDKFSELIESQGYVALPTPTNEKQAREFLDKTREQFLQYQVNRSQKTVAPSRLRYLDRIVSQCQANDIELILVVLPQLVDMDPNYMSEAYEHLEEVSASNEHVHLIDFVRETPLTELSWNSWADRYHLSDEGAEILSHELLKRLIDEPKISPLLGTSKVPREEHQTHPK